MDKLKALDHPLIFVLFMLLAIVGMSGVLRAGAVKAGKPGLAKAVSVGSC